MRATLPISGTSRTSPNYTFVKADICDFDTVLGIMRDNRVDGIIHLAAESHVDRSIKDPSRLPARMSWEPCASSRPPRPLGDLPEKYAPCRFYHISTDEVYGALPMPPKPRSRPAPRQVLLFTEET